MSEPATLRVVVTGASGRLGRRVTALCATQPGWETVSLVSPRVDPFGPNEVSVDLTRADALRSTLDDAQPHVIVHLAGLAGAACEAEPEAARRINSNVAVTLRDWAEQSGARRIVFASTAAVYGDQFTEPVTESAPLLGSSVYALSKLEGERALASSTLVESVSLRIFNIFGPGFDDSLVARLERSTSGTPVPLRGPHNFVRDYVHADDVARAVIASVRSAQSAAHLTVNIGSGVATTNEQLVERLSHRAPVFAEPVRGPRSYSVADISAARRLWDFSPNELP